MKSVFSVLFSEVPRFILVLSYILFVTTIIVEEFGFINRGDVFNPVMCRLFSVVSSF